MTNEEWEKLAQKDKFKECPLCTGKEDEGHMYCFHCSNCHYLQCCDCDGHYAKARSKI